MHVAASIQYLCVQVVHDFPFLRHSVTQYFNKKFFGNKKFPKKNDTNKCKLMTKVSVVHIAGLYVAHLH